MFKKIKEKVGYLIDCIRFFIKNYPALLSLTIALALALFFTGYYSTHIIYKEIKQMRAGSTLGLKMELSVNNDKKIFCKYCGSKLPVLEYDEYYGTPKVYGTECEFRECPEVIKRNGLTTPKNPQ